MKLLFDFLPVILFFATYKLGGEHGYTIFGTEYKAIYVATAVMMIATAIQLAYSWIRHHTIDRNLKITAVLVFLLGGATLLFHNADFIKWKPTAVNWLFALAFLLTPLFTKSSLLKKMIGEQIQLPENIWTRLNIAWIVFFIFSGSLNLYVAFNFSENTWVDFKLWGMLGLTLVFVIAQSVYLARHAVEIPKDND